MKIRPGSYFFRYFAAVFGLLLLTAPAIRAQTFAITFQGKLNDGGAAATGNYDFQFKLFGTAAGGSQMGATLIRANVPVDGGVFSTTLDLNPNDFNGALRFLEIAVRPAGSPNAFVVLGARQQILAVPYAVYAVSSFSAVEAQRAVNAQSANTATSAGSADFANRSFDSSGLQGLGPSAFARIDIPNPATFRADQLVSNGNLTVGGSAVQPAAGNGLVKAMIKVENRNIVKCYNGTTGQTTGGCGFTMTRVMAGVYNINLGFPANDRFVSLSVSNIGLQTLNNWGGNYRFNGTNLEVFTFFIAQPNDTADGDFMVIVY